MKNNTFIPLFILFLFTISCSKKELPIPQETENIYQLLRITENNEIFLEKLDGLFNDAKTKNYETGYILYPSQSSIFRFQIIQGNIGSASISFNPLSPIRGVMHSHYGSLYPCFSPADIKAIYDLYSNENIDDFRIFFSIVANAHENSYLILIEDINKFLRFARNNLSNPLNFQEFDNSFIYAQQSEFRKYRDIDISHENALLKLLSNSGLKLLKSSKTQRTWSEIPILNP